MGRAREPMIEVSKYCAERKGGMTTTYDFQDGKGTVPAHEHSNGGGWVADTAYVAPTAYVDPDAEVFGNARVYGAVSLYGSSRYPVMLLCAVRWWLKALLSMEMRGFAMLLASANLLRSAIMLGSTVKLGFPVLAF